MKRTQKEAQGRNTMKWRLSGVVLTNGNAPLTPSEKEALEKAQKILGDVLKNWDANSAALGFNIKR